MSDLSTPARIARGVVAGVIVGASPRSRWTAFRQPRRRCFRPKVGKDEPATEKAADVMATAVKGQEVPHAAKPLAGQSVHCAFGIGLGIAYGIAAEFRPSVTPGFGTAFGIGTATVLDEGAVPAVRLGDAPWKASLSTTLYPYAFHLVFGGTAEIVCRQVAGTLTP